MPPVQRWDGRRYEAPPRPIPIIELLREILFDTPELTCDELVDALHRRGVTSTVGDVLTVLHKQQGTFVGQSRHSPWDLTAGARQRVAQLRSQPARRQPARPCPPDTRTDAPQQPVAVPARAATPRATPPLSSRSKRSWPESPTSRLVTSQVESHGKDFLPTRAL